ncbi:MAG: fasciclin domain-containing protein [Rubripirellula sp.]
MKKALFAIAASVMVLTSGTQSALAGCGTCDKSIVEVAVEADNFKTLVAAVKAAGLVETLGGKGPFTVFAPTDEAFAKLPKGTVAELVKPENKEKLISILTYHVVPGKVMAKDVVKLTGAKTVQGSEAKIQVKDGNVMVDKAKVVKTDIPCLNGVIHVIDTVILPKE